MAEEPKKRGWKKKDHLTAEERQAMPKSEFALPGKGDGPKGAGSGSYPIPDEGHARAALSRVAANGTPAEKSAVRGAVHRRFPDMKVAGEKEKSRRATMYDHPRSRKAREADG